MQLLIILTLPSVDLRYFGLESKDRYPKDGMDCNVPPISSSGWNEIFAVMRPSLPKDHAVKKSRYSDEQIAYSAKQSGTGTPEAEMIRRMRISEQTFY
jgi:putative transposase